VGAAHRPRRHAAIPGAILAGLLGWCPAAFALNPSLDISQYGHTTWTARDGFVGRAQTFAQTPDGYLWIGGNGGLFRFDGVRLVRWPLPATGSDSPGDEINALLTARDGTLWINRISELISLKDGRFTRYPAPAGKRFLRLAEDRDGRIWTSAGAPADVCLVVAAGVNCSNGEFDLGPSVYGMFTTSTGDLWLGLQAGLARWQPGRPAVFSLTEQPDGYRAIAEAKGDLLVGLREGVARFADGKTDIVYPSPSGSIGRVTNALLVDRNGGLWGGVYALGLVHHHDGRTDVFTNRDGLSSDSVIALFEDREGSIWVGTSGGVDRFRDMTVARYSVPQGLSIDDVSAVLPARDGTVWIATPAGLHHWNRGRMTIYRERPGPTPPGVREIATPGFSGRSHSLLQDSRGRIWVSGPQGAGYLDGDRFVPALDTEGRSDIVIASIAEDRRGDIWIATNVGDEGIVHLRNDRAVERIPRSALGAGSGSRRPFAVVDPVRDGLWVGFFTGGGVLRLVDGHVQRSYSAADGLGRGAVHHLRVRADGSVWVSTEGGLSRLDDGRIATLDSGGGLPCDGVLWSLEDATGSLWIYTTCGLVRLAKGEVDSWVRTIAGRVRPDPVRFTLFDSTDGIPALPDVRPTTPQVAEARDGRIWFSMSESVGVIDPRNLRINALAPPVQIEQLIADGATYAATSTVRLPPRVRDLQIDYTALSLVAPEKNRFRIMLEGRDRDWQDVGTRRQAFYTDLEPRAYRFRVLASNNSGVWNEAGASLEFSIAPAYYQTRWFAALVVVATGTLLWVAYQLRVRQLARQFERTLDARVNERTRIARDLHDTLLQSFHGLLLRFQTVSYLLAERPAEAKEKLDGAIEQAAKAITEGRDAVQGLRTSTIEHNDLAVAIRALGDQLAASADRPPKFGVAVEGESRALHPIVRDDIYRIAAEALRNAFRHAHAGQVEVEIHYDDDQFRLRVRDDGRGIDPAVLASQGVEGHFGLRGMPERAALLGGKLSVWSEAGAGTEVELRLPARNIYAASRRRSWLSRVRASAGQPAHLEGDE
jgi:signal transduction histidine kinase/ligand-binding sensor domain-containing protein